MTYWLLLTFCHFSNLILINFDYFSFLSSFLSLVLTLFFFVLKTLTFFPRNPFIRPLIGIRNLILFCWSVVLCWAFRAYTIISPLSILPLLFFSCFDGYVVTSRPIDFGFREFDCWVCVSVMDYDFVFFSTFLNVDFAHLFLLMRYSRS